MNMTETASIEGPLGGFLIPNHNRRTREVCEYLSRQLFEGEYEHPEVRPPTEVLDIGAGWGAFSVWAIRKWAQTLRRLDAYEPHREAAEFYERNVFDRAAGLLGLRLHEVAVTTNPNAVYSVHEDWGAGRTHEQRSGRRVPLVHPKDLPPCDLLKVDAEGIEAELLVHYPTLETVTTILLEWHTPELKARCHQTIEARTRLRCVQQQDERERGYGVSIWVR
jgi:FkbM family methyltransferase